MSPNRNRKAKVQVKVYNFCVRLRSRNTTNLSTQHTAVCKKELPARRGRRGRFFLLSRLIVREKATRLSFDPILGLHVTFKYDCVLETEKSLFV